MLRIYPVLYKSPDDIKPSHEKKRQPSTFQADEMTTVKID